MDDWQDAVFSNRHVHNRVGKQGRGKGGKSNGQFNVQKTFGSYEVKCAAANKLASVTSDEKHAGRLEIYTLNDTGIALIGELSLPSVLHGTVLMAGSRKVMNTVIRDLERVVETEKTEERIEVEDQRDQRGEIEEDVDDEIESDEDNQQQQRFQEFEKNSFRSPKFWLKWQGEVLLPPDNTLKDTHVTDSGYIVFSGNDCGKFDGTLSCEALGWSNVKLSGWKTASRSARDFNVEWAAAKGRSEG